MRNTYLQQCDYGSRFRILKGGKISLVVSAFLVGTTLLHSAPSGGVVTSGSASIAQSGSVTNITQSSGKASINWQNFSIGASEVVNFNQPSATAITLNRVVGNEKSIIDGALNANGQVWILNSNGVLFSKTASINTAGLLATTQSLSDTDFNNGNYNFKGDSSASILNQGTINISDAGYAALFGKEVINEGIIKATLGKVQLSGASEVTLNLNGNSLVNLIVTKGVLDALVENKGAIIADGGEVYLTTNAVNKLLKGVVNNTGIVEAKTLDDITGKIELFAHGGTLHVDGTLDATGGFVETSGKTLHVSDTALVKADTWLLDPDNIIIESTGGAVGGNSVSATAIQNALSADIQLQATYDITVNEAITWSSDKKLTLTAGDEIYVNAIISNTNSTAGGVYFNAYNTTNKVIFGTDGKVIIYNVEQLQLVNTALNGKYELGGNINASATSTWNSGAGFTPIGNYSVAFTSIFDGLGHTINNLTISATTSYYQGFFGSIFGATIKNIGLTNLSVSGAGYVGGLVGSSASSTITNAYAIGSVSGASDVGGLVGSSASSTITNAYAIGSVSGADYVGGLVGSSYRDTITNAYATGSVSGQNYVGGLVGVSYQDIITNAYATGSVNGTTFVGGLVGFLGTGATVATSYYDKTINSTLTENANNVGKTTDELKTLATFSTWNIDGNDGSYPTLTMGGATIWTMAAASNGGDYQNFDWFSTPNVSHITNGTAVLPPVLLTKTPSTPMGDTPNQLVGMQEAQQMLQYGGSGDFRVPLGKDSAIQLINGGIRLPNGIEQEFFMAQR